MATLISLRGLVCQKLGLEFNLVKVNLEFLIFEVEYNALIHK